MVAAPQLIAGEPDATAIALLDVAAARFAAENVVLLHALPEVDAAADVARYQSAGFAHVCDLSYMVATARGFPLQPPAADLHFMPSGPDEVSRLMAVIQETYEGTWDCPQLNGVRSLDDVMAGYRAVGSFIPGLWFLVQNEGLDVGCLLLADHPSSNHWELIYMGIVPQSRGKGWGVQIARQCNGWPVARAARGWSWPSMRRTSRRLRCTSRRGSFPGPSAAC